MRNFIQKATFTIAASCLLTSGFAQNRSAQPLTDGWKFCFGNAQSIEKNFMTGTRYFNYLTKTGYGDGPTAQDFDDRAWRDVTIPHDWAVELPFAPNASHSHGYKTVGWAFPETSLGWYRKKINIPTKDLGKKISLLFEGVFRNSEVWLNGFYLGQEQSGYLDFQYDITDYINYGGENVIAVKADASLEEGWYYEGAGIYRNVWLLKTDPIHVDKDGISVSSNINGSSADISIHTKILNESLQGANVALQISITDSKKTLIAKKDIAAADIPAMASHDYYNMIKVSDIKCWSPSSPNLYNVEVKVISDGKQTDVQSTRIGLRTTEFTSDKGFFLNGEHLKIVGVNIHQDFAGVGCAVTKPLQIERVKMLKSWGFNAIRTSHNPVNVDLLDICDSLGVLILEETRLEGINEYHKSQLRRMIERDRNHPCIIAWSVGNEEWQIESNIYGNRITKTIQAYAKTIDSTRMITAAVSGGCGYGTSESLELMGFNYLAQCDIDPYHEKHLNQPGWLTEETSGCGTRGIYEADSANCHIPQFDRAGGTSIERGYKFCMERDWMSGLFYWTGFDYRGEATPFSYPAIGSSFGILDLCGFPKDQAYYILANNSDKPMVHIFPHWNHKELGKKIDVWVYSNCDEVELLVNKKSQGRQAVPKYGHASFNVEYEPGSVLVRGFKAGKQVVADEVKTTGAAAAINLQANKYIYSKKADDIILVSVSAIDAKGLQVPDANNNISFQISGPAEIIGVGNGDPSSLENDREIANSIPLNIKLKKELTLQTLEGWSDDVAKAKRSDWRAPLVNNRSEKWYDYHDTLLAVSGEFYVQKLDKDHKLTLYSKSILEDQTIFVNNIQVAHNIKRDSPQAIALDHTVIQEGTNEIIFVGKKFRKGYEWDEPNTDPGCVGQVIPAKGYSRNLFSGKALVVIKTNGKPGVVTLTATGNNLKEAKIQIK